MRHRVLHFLSTLTSILLLFVAGTELRADAPAFDLSGPKVDVHVQRNGKTLPIADVPNLLPGDRLWIHPDLPETQSAHFVLVVAFLRGATNPPPPEWFRRVETWNPQVRQEGVFVVVPAEAQQALLFLAPETSGDFSTLRAAVRGRPGAFVRATQDLQQASWDRLRLDAYLTEVKTASIDDPKDLKDRTALAARSLNIRVDQQCFDKPTEQQAPCLVQHTEGLVLDDANAQSLVTQLANGSTADLMNQLSYSGTFGAGQFSPYVGAVVDLARILSTLHTAHYQYIPALALPQKDTLNLRLNVPPSFRDPKSVIVVALPPIMPAHMPLLHPIDPAQNYCAQKPGLALIAEGAPLVFATSMAHDLVLHIETKATLPPDAPAGEHPGLLKPAELKPGQDRSAERPEPETSASAKTTPASKKPGEAEPAGIDIPVRAAPSEGGLVLEKPLPSLPEDEVTGVLRGKWGFDIWEGPKFHLRTPHPGGWTVPSTDINALITGREDTLHVQGESTLCVSDVQGKIPLEDAPESPKGKDGPKPTKLAWKSPKPDLLEITVPLKDAAAGTVTIAIHQYGLPVAEELPLKAYAEAAGLDRFSLSAGDRGGLLKGRRLDEVDAVDLAGITFVPAALNRVDDADQLEMTATGVTATLQPGKGYSAKVTLRDGRQLHVPATVGVSRPQVDLLSKGIQHDESGAETAPLPVHLGSPNDLPLQRRLVFFIRSRVPVNFPRSQKIEIAATDGSFGTTLSLADSSLMLEDSHTAVAVLDPLARFGASAFGPIQLRAVTADGITGDWVPLGTLVRLPGFPAANALRCPRSQSKPCTLTGSNLFLITAVSATADMSNPSDVPPDFTGNTLSVPNTARSGTNGTLYLSLRDDPSTVQTLTLPLAGTGNQPAPTAAGAASQPESSPAASSNSGSNVGGTVQGTNSSAGQSSGTTTGALPTPAKPDANPATSTPTSPH
jgi:hypothetical protein